MLALAQIVNFGPHFATIFTFIYLLNTEEVHHFRASNVFTVFAFTSIICLYTRHFQCKGYTYFQCYSDLPKAHSWNPKIRRSLCFARDNKFKHQMPTDVNDAWETGCFQTDKSEINFHKCKIRELCCKISRAK